MDARSVERVYDRYARIYDRVFGGVFEPGRAAALGGLQLRPGDSVLEVGIGTGLCLARYPHGCRVVGIDVSHGMLQRAARQVRVRGLRNVELLRMDAQAMAFQDNSFDEVHAYELLEHLGQQGDIWSFFGTFAEIHRILRPEGRLAATVPRWDSMWAWGDPGHTRVINEGSLAFLSQEQYRLQVGKTPMADYRSVWKGDFEPTWTGFTEHNFMFTLRAVKPARL